MEFTIGSYRKDLVGFNFKLFAQDIEHCFQIMEMIVRVSTLYGKIIHIIFYYFMDILLGDCGHGMLVCGICILQAN